MEGTSNSFAGLFFAVLSYFMLIKLVALLLLQLETNYAGCEWAFPHTDSLLCCLIPSTLTPGCSSLLRYLVLTWCTDGERGVESVGKASEKRENHMAHEDGGRSPKREITSVANFIFVAHIFYSHKMHNADTWSTRGQVCAGPVYMATFAFQFESLLALLVVNAF